MSASRIFSLSSWPWPTAAPSFYRWCGHPSSAATATVQSWLWLCTGRQDRSPRLPKIDGSTAERGCRSRCEASALAGVWNGPPDRWQLSRAPRRHRPGVPWRTDGVGATVRHLLCSIQGTVETQQVCKGSPFLHHRLFPFATPQSAACSAGSRHHLAEKPSKTMARARLLGLDTGMSTSLEFPPTYHLVQGVRQALGVLGTLAFHQFLVGRGIVRGCPGLP